jgi:hypothetical protein
MSIAPTKSKSCHHKTRSRQFFTNSRERLNVKVTAINLLFLAVFFIQMQYSTVDTKPPILINFEFNQPQKLQLCFRPMGKYATSTFTSHIQIPFTYSSWMNLQQKMNDWLHNFFDVLKEWNFNVTFDTIATVKSTFKMYKDNTNEIFKLFHNLLTSLPHVQECHRHQWDVTSFVAATAALSLVTYNTIQISKLETAIEAQQAKKDLLTDITKLHEQHLHKLDGMIDEIGNELQVMRMQQQFQVRVDTIVAQITSDKHKLRAVIATFERIILTAFNQKLVPGALSTDVLHQIIYHINDITAKNKYNKFVH